MLLSVNATIMTLWHINMSMRSVLHVMGDVLFKRGIQYSTVQYRTPKCCTVLLSSTQYILLHSQYSHRVF